jgi:competence protein ComEA
MKALLASFALALALTSSPSWAVVDINTATQSELEAVRGLGPSKAKAIIEYREKNGPFKSVDDLDNVKGFGKATVDKLKSELTVGAGAEKAAK